MDLLSEPVIDVDHLNIFTPMRKVEYLKDIVITDDLDKFEKPLLERADSRDQIEYIQRLCGKTGQQAMNIAIEVVGDMERGTQYPPDVKPTATPPELAAMVNMINEKITLKKREAAAEKD